MLLAHWDGEEQRAQSLKDHSENVARMMEENCFSLGLTSVSYTHLDVYTRQVLGNVSMLTSQKFANRYSCRI